MTTNTDTAPIDDVDPPARSPANKTLTALTALIVVLLAAVTVAVYTVIPQALSDVENAASNPVTVANPVHEVTVANPVDEVTVTNIVETAAPRDASLWGYCTAFDDGTYDIHVIAFSGGIEKTVAEGSYTTESASTIAFDIADYYFGDDRGLDFGDSSAECSHLDGWTQ